MGNDRGCNACPSALFLRFIGSREARASGLKRKKRCNIQPSSRPRARALRLFRGSSRRTSPLSVVGNYGVVLAGGRFSQSLIEQPSKMVSEEIKNTIDAEHNPPFKINAIVLVRSPWTRSGHRVE